MMPRTRPAIAIPLPVSLPFDLCDLAQRDGSEDGREQTADSAEAEDSQHQAGHGQAAGAW